jgi:hypothetical protein
MRFHLGNNKPGAKTPQVPTLGAHFSGWNKRKQRAAHLKLRDVRMRTHLSLSGFS